mgnify:FL=1
MAKGKSKGRNNSGGGGTATIIGTNNADTINFINKQVKDLGITGNIEVEFRERKRGDAPFAAAFVNHSNSVIKEGDTYYHVPIMKLTVLSQKTEHHKEYIAHELTHIKQMQSGTFRLGYKVKPIYGTRYDEGFYWNGKLHTTAAQYTRITNKMSKPKSQEEYNKALAKYKALPWEAEAYAAGGKYK